MSGHEKTHKYDGIIRLPHHISERHRAMPVTDRAAQFSPFAALTGYDAAIAETARETERRIEIDEYEKAALDQKLRLIREHIGQRPEITVTYFLPDLIKEGGAYRTVTGRLKKIAEYEGALVFEDGLKISLKEIVGLEFSGMAW